MEVEVALQYNDGYTENVEIYVNVINTINGGSTKKINYKFKNIVINYNI